MDLLHIAAFTKSTRVNSQDYELKLVDTAGQDEYSIFPTQYSMDIHGYVLVYSITSAKSFEIVQIIYDKLLDITGKLQSVIYHWNPKNTRCFFPKRYMNCNIACSVPIVLVGNKTDLYVDRMITTDQGKRLANSWNAAFLETSAKQNEVIDKIFCCFYWKLLCQFLSPVCCRYFSHITDRDREG